MSWNWFGAAQSFADMFANDRTADSDVKQVFQKLSLEGSPCLDRRVLAVLADLRR